MRDLTTRYLGLDLAHPLVAGAGPLAATLDGIRRLEDGGAAAIVLPSLFEEQLRQDEVATMWHIETHADSYGEATDYFPDPADFRLGPERHLEILREAREAVDVPIIASLNGTSTGGWVHYAALLAEAGAAALELNVYDVVTDFERTAADVEDGIVELVGAVRSEVSIPFAVKLSHFHTAIPHLAGRLVEAGADGLVLFNRFYQPDIDIEELVAAPHIELSRSHELLLRIRWIAVLRARLAASLAASGGVHEVTDVVKALMAGADVCQTTSALLRHGPARLAALRDGLADWMDEHDYPGLDVLRGSMSVERAPDRGAFERANYIETLASWRGPT